MRSNRFRLHNSLIARHEGIEKNLKFDARLVATAQLATVRQGGDFFGVNVNNVT